MDGQAIHVGVTFQDSEAMRVNQNVAMSGYFTSTSNGNLVLESVLWRQDATRTVFLLF